MLPIRYWRSAPILLFLFSGAVCVPTIRGGDPRLSDIRLPEGFRIEVFAEGVVNARGMCLGDRGTLFVGSRSEGSVYALVDTDGDLLPDTLHVLAEDLELPVGVAFRAGDLFISAVDRILVMRGIEDRLADPPAPEVIHDGFPDETHHGWKYLAFGPDGMLYVPVGAPCNICDPEDSLYATITKLDLESGERVIVAHGVRNSVGFDWDPRTGDLWFTDNGRDMLGDDLPPCELNHAERKGQHFGYPYCHGRSVPDPEFGVGHTCSAYTPPAQELGAHVAPLGMKFYRGSMFPEEYRNASFIAEHGSWNRSTPSGYRVTCVRTDADGTSSYSVFAEGWLTGTRAWGRPVDILALPDGSLLVSDDAADMIYRISYAQP